MSLSSKEAAITKTVTVAENVI